MENHFKSNVDIAKEYVARGWCPLPIRHREKVPKIKDWPSYRAMTEKLKDDFRSPCNIGVLLGDASGGLTDVDLDSSEARSLAPRILPPTDACFGRYSSRYSHLLYMTNLAKTK